jgi:hypothetical protein
MCLYRGPKGKKCAIGALIPDEKYESSFETHDVSSNPMIAKAAGLRSNQLYLAQYLQTIHDGTHANGWRKALQDLAKAEKLEMVDV